METKIKTNLLLSEIIIPRWFLSVTSIVLISDRTFDQHYFYGVLLLSVWTYQPNFVDGVAHDSHLLKVVRLFLALIAFCLFFNKEVQWLLAKIELLMN